MAEQNDLMGTNQTCIHGAIDVSYDWSGEQVYAANTSQYQIVALYVAEKRSIGKTYSMKLALLIMNRLEIQTPGDQGRIRDGRQQLLPELP